MVENHFVNNKKPKRGLWFSGLFPNFYTASLASKLKQTKLVSALNCALTT